MRQEGNYLGQDGADLQQVGERAPGHSWDILRPAACDEPLFSRVCCVIGRRHLMPNKQVSIQRMERLVALHGPSSVRPAQCQALDWRDWRRDDGNTPGS